MIAVFSNGYSTLEFITFVIVYVYSNELVGLGNPFVNCEQYILQLKKRLNFKFRYNSHRIHSFILVCTQPSEDGSGRASSSLLTGQRFYPKVSRRALMSRGVTGKWPRIHNFLNFLLLFCFQYNSSIFSNYIRYILNLFKI